MKALAAAFWPAIADTRRPRRSLRVALDAGSAIAAIAALAIVAGPLLHAQSMHSNADAAGDTALPPAPLSPPTGEVMFAGYGGAQFTYPSDVVIKKTGLHDFTAKKVPWDGEPFTSPIYYGARIVKWFETGRTGVMLDFTHSKALGQMDAVVPFEGTINGEKAPEKARVGDVFRRLEASHGHNMLTFNGLMRLPALGARFHPYVGLGAGVNLPHSEIQMIKDPGRTYEYQFAGPVAQAIIGIEFRVPRMSYFFEYKFTFASYQMPLTQRDGSILFIDLWKQLKDWLSGEEPPGGHLWTTYVSHQGIFGLGARFAAAPAAAR